MRISRSLEICNTDCSSLKKWLHEHTSVLRYAYIACLVCKNTSVSATASHSAWPTFTNLSRYAFTPYWRILNHWRIPITHSHSLTAALTFAQWLTLPTFTHLNYTHTLTRLFLTAALVMWHLKFLSPLLPSI